MRTLTAFLLALPAVVAAQGTPPADRYLTRLQPALSALQRDNAWTLDQQVAVCQVPAPPFKEAARAAWYQQALIRLGYPDTRIDAEGNVIAELRGGDGPTVMLAGHLDTVFPEGIDATVQRDGTRLDGIGIGDDCRGLAVVLAVAKVVKDQGIVPAGRILFVGNVGEEGAGNLRGVRHLLEREFRGQVDYFISVDGVGQNIVSRAVGSHRYTITIAGPGGHSYSDFGMPNPTHALGRAIARIGDLRVPDRPRSTFNVGIVRGGTSVNSIAMRAQMDIDMRSEDAGSLADLDRRIRAAVDTAVAQEMARWPGATAALTVTYDTIGIRPTGAQSDDAPIVRVAMETAKLVGFAPRTAASSTDANLPIAMGIPGIAIDGGGKGDGAHSLAEWYDDGPDGYKGPQWALLLVTALTGLR
jgi:tripeptide aminopeptidase